MTLVPAYGRDYRSKAAILADFQADKDFIIADMSSRYDGKPANRKSLIQAGVTSVHVRYARLTRIAVVKVR
jgi:hypothetical protein